MKKIGTFLVGAIFLVTPLVTSAQTYTPEQKASLITALQQLVLILNQQIQQIILQKSQASSTPSIFTTPSGAIINQDGIAVSVPLGTSTTTQVVNIADQILSLQNQIYQLQVKEQSDEAALKKQGLAIQTLWPEIYALRDKEKSNEQTIQLQIANLRLSN